MSNPVRLGGFCIRTEFMHDGDQIAYAASEKQLIAYRISLGAPASPGIVLILKLLLEIFCVARLNYVSNTPC